jgi:hypothetical protein
MKIRVKIIYILIFSLVLFSSCGVSKHLVYIDKWEGNYSLFEYNSCCVVKTKVKLILTKIETEKYNWKLYYEEDKNNLDTLYGKAIYQRNKLKFNLNKNQNLSKYFGNEVEVEVEVFNLEYDRYYSDKNYDYIDYYTRWNHSLSGFKNRGGFASGISYHFKIKERDNIKRPKLNQ